MSTRRERGVSRTRDGDSLVPGGPSAQQIRVLGTDLAERVRGQKIPSDIADETSESLKILVRRINRALRQISNIVGPLQEGVGDAVTGPPTGTDNAIARWDGTNGKKLQDSGWFVLDAIGGAFPLTNVSSYAGQVWLYVEGNAEFNAPTGDAELSLHAVAANQDSALRYVHNSSLRAKTYWDSSVGEFLIELASGPRIKLSASGFDFNGNIIISGTVDGRDVATDGTKLDGIEATADVTDATNVAAAGAVMSDDIWSMGKEALTISSGAVTVSKSYIQAAAESGTADDLATINGLSDGDIIVVRADAGDTITIKDGTGNIFCTGSTDYVLTASQRDMWVGLCTGANVVQIGGSQN